MIGEMSWPIEGKRYPDGSTNLLEILLRDAPRMLEEYNEIMEWNGEEQLELGTFTAGVALSMGFVGEIDIVTGKLDGVIYV
jgi:hypothetical protein